ncbi:DUF2141 domain-containing protein [Congregibacter variabilis]|uniref:DUF2141 domain-containing protein n=1 Tax=Congregibacter variabilis TaxID=3081200 RepID=A0ABZ0I0T4_9GAMM|nr:DUF2141 domain-containing protein [Congregibacter sp. IMCC43200]
MSLSNPLNLLTGAAFVVGTLLATHSSAEQLIVDVVGIERLGGTMMVAIFDSAEAWEDSSKAISVGKDSVSGPTVRLIFPNLPAGRYAVKLYHDEDNDGQLDSNMLGIPSEGYGFSNNPQVLGEPEFEEAMFIIEGDTNIQITLN